MVYDDFNYDIKSKLPLWWQEDTFLEPINRYTQQLLKDLIGGFLTHLGVVQPVQVWKSLPTEYSWLHDYIEHDNLLKTPEGHSTSKMLIENRPIRAEIPSSKRNRHGIIQLQLTGNNTEQEQSIGKLTIKNAHQQITINNITTMSDIKIITETQTVLIDGVQRSDLVTGSFDKIYSQAKSHDYDELDIDDENKITYIELESDTDVYFDLRIKHIHPIYVTEQNIRLYTVSAFPLESVTLYGFYCNEFNNKQEWRYLWKKEYDLDDRIVYDQIAKQFNCETFYVQVKYHGIGVPLTYGFPQEEMASDAAFNINTQLDKWGKIFGLPRRYYKNHITDNEEPFTFPPFYKYNIEQDYWYEQRLVNEYRYNEDAINSAYIKDTNLNNIALLQSIDPFIEDVYVYTETIAPTIDNTRVTGYINPTIAEGGEGQSWKNPHQIANTNYVGAEVTLNPKAGKYISDEKTYQTKVLELRYGTIPELPKNITITGLEIKLAGITDIHSSSLELDDRSKMFLPIYSINDDRIITDFDVVPINNENHYWEKEKGVYSIGGQGNLFGLESIDRNQLQNGISFEIAFTNNNDFMKASITLYSAQLFIYYDIIPENYDFDVELDKYDIILDDDNHQQIQLKIHLKNNGLIPVTDKHIYIAIPPELSITRQTFPLIDLDLHEPFTVGDTAEDKIIITCPDNITGFYDIIIFCDDKVIKKTITVKESDLI